MSSMALQPNRDSHSPAPALSGIWIAVGAITMSFAAFTSSLIIRQASDDWRHLALPGILYLNTLVLLASSVTLELARGKNLANLARSEEHTSELQSRRDLVCRLLLEKKKILASSSLTR